MDAEFADAIADGYERWAATGDQSVLALFSPTFVDNVSGQRGLVIFEAVGRWLEESFADRHIEHHATMFDGDKVMVWYTQHGRHVGNGFPRLRGCAVTGAQVRWTQVHVFRVEAGKSSSTGPYAMISRCSNRSTRQTADRLHTVVDQELTHDGGSPLARHVANAILREDSRGARLAKEHKDSPRHIDGAVAAVMAVHRAAELAGAARLDIYI